MSDIIISRRSKVRQTHYSCNDRWETKILYHIKNNPEDYEILSEDLDFYLADEDGNEIMQEAA